MLYIGGHRNKKGENVSIRWGDNGKIKLDLKGRIIVLHGFEFWTVRKINRNNGKQEFVNRSKQVTGVCGEL